MFHSNIRCAAPWTRLPGAAAPPPHPGYAPGKQQFPQKRLCRPTCGNHTVENSGRLQLQAAKCLTITV